jgi:hypothetical protein
VADGEDFDRFLMDAICDLVADTRQDQVAGIFELVGPTLIWRLPEHKNCGVYLVDDAMRQAGRIYMQKIVYSRNSSAALGSQRSFIEAEA